MRQLLILITALFIGVVVSAQSTEQLITEGNTNGEQNTVDLNPLFCTDTNCTRIVNELFPFLLNIDAETNWLTPADDESGLVEAWEIDENTVTFTLRDGLTWSDGTPITAYDVFYSYQIAYRTNAFGYPLGAHVEGAVPLDELTIQFVLVEATCNSIPQINFQVIPAHVYDPEFADSIEYNGGDVVVWFENFPKTPTNFLEDHPEYSNPTVTYGAYQLAERRYNESIRLLSVDGKTAFSFEDVVGDTPNLQRFLRGEYNILADPPYTRLDDLQADDAVTLHSYDGYSMFVIALNQADPDEPLSAFDEDGNPIEQIAHPILVDPVVREAMQLALDVPAMIDAVLEGHGQQLGGLMPPAYFAHTDYDIVSRDVMQARQMLFDAGWRDMDGDGVRECLYCEFAESGAELSISLSYIDSLSGGLVDVPALSQLVSKQLGNIGIEVSASPQSSYSVLFDQKFDAFIVSDIPMDLFIVTVWDFFRRDLDIVDDGYNFTSYYNPEVERLLDEANHVPDCDPDSRSALYQQVEDILIADKNYLWLFSPNRIIATRQSPDLPIVNWEEILP